MLKFDMKSREFKNVEETALKQEKILERYDLQEAIVNSWEQFRNEIGLPTSYLIGKEVNPHRSTNNSIDLLAYDPDDSSLIVIELKRDKDKLQLLQALSYAAMVSKWDTDELVSKIQPEHNADFDELVDLITGSESITDVKVILVSEYYDPEVILTSDWLSGNYGVDITAFSISLFKLDEETLLSLDQRFPLKDLDDVYELRGRRKKAKHNEVTITWEDILPKLKYPFASRGIELCKNFSNGDPGRRRFVAIRTNYDGFTWININFRQKYMNIYLKGDYEGATQFLQSKFTDEITINSWRDGLNFCIEKERQFNDLVAWLNLE